MILNLPALRSKKRFVTKNEGWNPEAITNTLDVVILGMHARKDNPELVKAQQLGLKIYSFPEYIYNHSIDKQRVIIAGSHGKTTITGIVVHVLNYYNRSFDYVIGARIKGVENPVKLSDAPVIVIEGDEYLCSALDPTPKFLRYQHHIGLISGVAWDHANVFPTEEEYLETIRQVCRPDSQERHPDFLRFRPDGFGGWKQAT